MAPLLLCFMSGLVVGAVGHWAARPAYWRAKWSIKNHSRYPRRRFLRHKVRRHRFYLRALTRRSYAGYTSDYRLSKLFDRLDQRQDD